MSGIPADRPQSTVHLLHMDQAGARRLVAVALATDAKHLSRCGHAERGRTPAPDADPHPFACVGQAGVRRFGGRGRNRGGQCGRRPARWSRAEIRPPGARRRGGVSRVWVDRSERLALAVQGDLGQQLGPRPRQAGLNAQATEPPGVARDPHATGASGSKREHRWVSGLGRREQRQSATTTPHGAPDLGLCSKRAGGFEAHAAGRPGRTACATRPGALPW